MQSQPSEQPRVETEAERVARLGAWAAWHPEEPMVARYGCPCGRCM